MPNSTIQNQSTIREIRTVAGITALENPTFFLGNQVVPVVEVNPKMLRKVISVRNASSTATGAVTIFTAVSNKDTYLTGISLSYVKDATCDVASGPLNINVTIDGTVRSPISISVITLVAQSDTVFVNLSEPIKIDKGSAVQMSGTFSVGVLVRNATARYFEVESFQNL